MSVKHLLTVLFVLIFLFQNLQHGIILWRVYYLSKIIFSCQESRRKEHQVRLGKNRISSPTTDSNRSCANELFCYLISIGWWTLIEKAPPDRNRSKQTQRCLHRKYGTVRGHLFLQGLKCLITLLLLNWSLGIELKPKNKVVQKSGVARHPTAKVKDKRARAKGSPSKKKTRFDETSSDEEFRSFAKVRNTASVPTTRIKVAAILCSEHCKHKATGKS